MTVTTASPVSTALSPARLAIRRFCKHRLALIGAIVLVLLVLVAIIGPVVYPIDPNAVDVFASRKPPTGEHPLGTDSAGRDVLARLLAGGRVSLTVALAATIGAAAIGALAGAIAGYLRGAIDAVLSRIADVVLSFPTLIVLTAVVAFVGPSLQTLVIALALFEWPQAFRIVRGATLSLREQEYVLAARGLGGSSVWVLARHILPAVVAPLTVVATLLIAQAILLEATLSFLGLGVQPPTASWGNMLNEAQSLAILQSMPWLWLPPGILIAVAVLSVNFVGDGLRDAADPRRMK
ncbi:ABC transporter permease [Microbacterium sp. ZW T5_56]|uniref:ABC transporter permease n=1 Tax=Microbacterium sp. ZW T5_56 TaxID=3378081 RepID=UPI003853F377